MHLLPNVPCYHSTRLQFRIPIWGNGASPKQSHGVALSLVRYRLLTPTSFVPPCLQYILQAGHHRSSERLLLCWCLWFSFGSMQSAFLYKRYQHIGAEAYVGIGLTSLCSVRCVGVVFHLWRTTYNLNNSLGYMGVPTGWQTTLLGITYLLH